MHIGKPKPVASQHVSSESKASDEEDTLATSVERFWEVESVPEPSPTALMSPSDRECERHFIASHCPKPDGRFVVRLPFKVADFNFKGSFNLAKKSLIRLEKKFSSNPGFEI